MLRPLKFSKYLPRHRWIPHILTVKEWLYSIKDYKLAEDIPPEAVVYRTFALDSARHLAIKGRRPALFTVPDRFLSWLPFGIVRGLHIIKKGNIHALYSTSPPPTAHLIAGALKGVTALPWVADFRDPWIEDGPHAYPGMLRYQIDSTLERFVVCRADRLIVTTPYLGKELCSRYPELLPDKIQVIFNGYDEADFQNLTNPAHKHQFEIVHAGLVTPDYRDPLPLLRAVGSLNTDGILGHQEIKVTFLGGGSYVRSKDFAESVKQLGLAKVVDVINRVSHQEALQRMHEAAALLLLQASDDTKSLIPAKAFEYLRISRPILALTTESATGNLLKGMSYCYVIDLSDQSKIRQAVMELYRLWKRSPDGVQVRRHIWQYERSNLTAELAGLLEKLIQRH
jgi:glycosyltransferase involved in cell wall biosynthesis